MSWSNGFTRAIGVELPIVQAPMAGATTVEMVAAVSNAGALGSYAAGYLPPDDIASAIAAIREHTERPFAMNVFAPMPDDPPVDAEPILRVMAKLHAELGLDPPALPARLPIALDEQLAVIAEERVPVVSFTFGVLPERAISRLKDGGVYLIGTATTVDEALMLERAGVDAVVAQGSEAGGHRGSFGTSATSAPGLIGTMALVPQIAGAVRLPVIAAGGIMDGRGIVAARALGASAAQLGTAFLTSDESGAPDPVKEALVRATENDTVVTALVTGKHGRAVRNRLTEAFESAGVAPLSFGWQSALLGNIRRAAAAQGRADLLPLFAGQGLRLLRRGPAADLLRELMREAEATIAALSVRALP